MMQLRIFVRHIVPSFILIFNTLTCKSERHFLKTKEKTPPVCNEQHREKKRKLISNSCKNIFRVSITESGRLDVFAKDRFPQEPMQRIRFLEKATKENS